MKQPATLSVLTFLLVTASFSFAQTYTITDLGLLAPEGNYTFSVTNGRSINSSGVVVGNAFALDCCWRGWIYKNAAMTDLMKDFDDPTGGNINSINSDYGPGINDAGQVVGTIGYLLPFFYDGATFQVMTISCTNGVNTMIPFDGVLQSGAYAIDINNTGQVVGWANLPYGANCDTSSSEHAYIWSTITGKLTDLGVLPGTPATSRSFASAINDHGQVTGYAQTLAGGFHAFFYSSKGMIDISPTPTDYQSYGRGINSRGHVAGNYQSSTGYMHTFLYNGKTVRDLDPPDPNGNPLYGYTVGWDINSSDQIVGLYCVPTCGITEPSHAILYKSGTTTGFTYLDTLIPNDSGWTLVDARAINDSGQITGTGIIDGASHAYLLTPIKQKGGRK